MREIKFRARRIDNERWVYGQYFRTPLTDENSGTTPDAGWFFLSGEPRHCIVQYPGVSFVIDLKTLGQFTGLHDKNGKEIYEGDILLHHKGYSPDELILCRWQEAMDDGKWTVEKPGFRFERINGAGTTIWVAHKHLEVIGNIYEHPDLLKE